MALSLVVFDLDGTLIDSAEDLAVALNGMLSGFGCEPLPLAEVRLMIGDGVATLVARALSARRCKHADPIAASRLFMLRYESAPTLRTAVFPGAKAALEALRGANLPLAVCTNKPERLAARILETLGLAGYFARVVGGDSMPFRKPDPRVLLAIVDALGASPQNSLLVGDSEVDAMTSQAAAVPFVLMTHGYRRGPVAEIPCIAALPGFSELPALVRGLAG